jgi:hypothetical protein
MRKMLAALLLVLALALSLGQEKALADDCSNVTINTGSATVVTQLYASQCVILGWDRGSPGTRNMRANCCGPSAVIRVNGYDWNRLVEQGKLDGLRYIRVSKNAEGAYVIEPRQMATGGNPVSISGRDFFK